MNEFVSKAQRKTGWSIFTSIAALMAFSFLMGTIVVELDLFPYPQFFKRAYESFRYQFGNRLGGDTDDVRYRPCRTAATGVTKRSSQAFAGYTLLVSCKEAGAVLVDLDGREVHRWRMPFYRVWPQPAHLTETAPEESIYSVHAHLFPNGDLVLNYNVTGLTPYGLGLAKIDKDSTLLWRYPGRSHHSFEVAADGTIYSLTHEYRRLTDADRPPQLTVDTILEDFVVAISPTGQELWKISLFDAIQSSPEYRSLATTYNGWDLTHCNAVRVISEDFAHRHDFCRAGQLLLSFRNTDTLAVLDLEARRITWAARGFWKQQHCPTFAKDGRLMIFDNQGFASRGKTLDVSRVVEFDPTTNQISWEYHGGPQAPFFSRFRGYEQILPNGNVLITESHAGRVFEVASDQTIVWEYYSPERIQYDGLECVWSINSAQRFSQDECQFLAPPPDR